MITNIQQIHNAVQVQKGAKSTGSNEIVGNFKQIFDEVNQEQLKADEMIAELAAGKNKDIPGTMIQMEKAETSLKMLMAVRTKALNAYEEIMRMQI